MKVHVSEKKESDTLSIMMAFKDSERISEVESSKSIRRKDETLHCKAGSTS